MTWEDVVELEPRLLEVEAWISSLDGSDPCYDEEGSYVEMKRRINPLVGWKRIIPSYEEVPFEDKKGYLNLGELWKHHQETGNIVRRDRFLALVPEHLQVLYTSEAWNTAGQYLLNLLPRGKW